MKLYIIRGKNNYNELACEWSDGTITDIVYADLPHMKYEIINNKRQIYSQCITYGEKAGKELAEHILKCQKQPIKRGNK